MSRIEWNDSLKSNHEEIDKQHYRWIEIYNKLHDTLLSKGSVDNLLDITRDTLKSIEDYAQYHFKYEEEFMKTMNFPHIVEHKRLHKDFDTQIYELNRDIREGRAVLNTQLIKMMKNWIEDHILNSDKKYIEYYNSHYKQDTWK